MATITKLQYNYLIKTSEQKAEFVKKVKQETGIGKTSFYSYIRGEQMPPKLVKEKIAELIGIPVKELYKEHYTTIEPKI